MATLNDYFRTEARDFLTTLERSLKRTPAPDAAEVHRAARGLRGTAQMAREQRIYDVISAFEAVTRSLAGGALTWSDQVAARARDTIADLRALMDPVEDDDQLDARVADAIARWRHTTTTAPAPAAAGPAPAAPAAAVESTREFREFTAREAAGIADAIDRGLTDLQADPMDREPLRHILRRQRALLGAARLDEVPVVAEILRAVEDLTRVIARLDVGVKKEWLDIYRVARDALQTTIAPLLRDEKPEPSHAVSRLRHMRAELIERYGAADAEPAHENAAQITSAFMAPPQPASSAHGAATHAPGQAPQPIAPFLPRTQQHSPATAAASAPPASAPAPAALRDDEDEGVLELDEDSVVAAEPASTDEEAADIIEIDTLSYTREDALDRALELHDVIAAAVAADARAHDAVEELFDLIRIARGER